MWKEATFFLQHKQTQQRKLMPFIQPPTICMNYFRYMDNILFLKRPQVHTTQTKHAFERIYDLTLQHEQEGFSINTLEAKLTIKNGKIQMTTKPRDTNKITTPDRHSTELQRFLQTYIPSIVKKCLHYAVPQGMQMQNLTQIMKWLDIQFPREAWLRLFRKCIFQNLPRTQAPSILRSLI